MISVPNKCIWSNYWQENNCWSGPSAHNSFPSNQLSPTLDKRKFIQHSCRPKIWGKRGNQRVYTLDPQVKRLWDQTRMGLMTLSWIYNRESILLWPFYCELLLSRFNSSLCRIKPTFCEHCWHPTKLIKFAQVWLDHKSKHDSIIPGTI